MRQLVVGCVVQGPDKAPEEEPGPALGPAPAFQPRPGWLLPRPGNQRVRKETKGRQESDCQVGAELEADAVPTPVTSAWSSGTPLPPTPPFTVTPPGALGLLGPRRAYLG